MFKKAILFLGSAFCFGAVSAQVAEPCASTEHHKQQVRMFPQISAAEAQLEQDIKATLDAQVAAYLSQNLAAKGTNADWNAINRITNDSMVKELHIPVVVHIIHNYGSDYIPDNKVYQLIQDINKYYHVQNDTTSVIKPFKQYVGNAHITFHLATRDPQGQPTTGITRHYTYLTAGGDELAKMDQWPAHRYLNIWSELRIGRPIAGGIVAAYSRFPADGTQNPYGDGIISNSLFIGDNGSTIAHEVGHYFNLLHVWNSNGMGACDAGAPCGDDAVDDTPPTTGHFSGTCPTRGCQLYDTMDCVAEYKKTYSLGGNSVTVDFPDTVNTQNIMDYSDCTNMFTVGQVARMRATLYSNTTIRAGLKDTGNLVLTGVYDSVNHRFINTPDLAPIADFSVNRNFVCAGLLAAPFVNRSWRDTVSGLSWTFSNSATPGTSTSLAPATAPLNVTFGQPGWATASLTATSNAGNNTLSRDRLVYVADPTPVATPTSSYYQEFDQGSGSDVDQYPIFNYYNVPGYKWEVVNNLGYFDNSCIKYNNYDPRPSATLVTSTQSPGGNYSDFYTRAFDLTGSEFATRCNFTFYAAGAFRTTNTRYMNDSLIVTFSDDCGLTWKPAFSLAKGDLAASYSSVYYAPLSQSEWRLISKPLPSIAKKARVYFRIRFVSGTDNGEINGYPWGTGNNFYMDRINITGNPTGISTPELEAKGMILAPNPTNGSATLTIPGGDNSLARVNVTDITGKVIYRTDVRLINEATQVEIPATSISVKGMYMVQVIANNRTQTQKLVVY